MNNYTENLMCDLCEINILGCKHHTSTFMCEGSRCEDARELLNDYIVDNEPYVIERHKRFEKNLGYAESILSELDCSVDYDLDSYLHNMLQSNEELIMINEIIEDELK